MKKRAWFMIGAGLAVIIGIVVLTILLRGEPVPAVRLKRENVVATLTVTGEVRADTTVAFSPPVSARILSINADEGDRIAPGALLVQLDAGQAEARFGEAQARAAQAQAALANVLQGTRPEQIRLREEQVRESRQRIRQSQAALASAKSRSIEAASNAHRMQSLFQEGFATAQESESAATQADVTRQDITRAQADLHAAQNQRRQAEAQLAEARNGRTGPEIREASEASRAAWENVRQAREQLRDYRISSAMTGIVTQRLQDPGELATPGQPILRAVNPTTLEILCSVEEGDLPKVRVGEPAYAILDALPETPLDARVKRIGNQVNPENGTVEMRVVLTPAGWKKLGGARFLPGMTADVNVVTERLEAALVLPATAVRNESGQWVAYLFQGGRLVRRPIQGERISVESFLELIP